MAPSRFDREIPNNRTLRPSRETDANSSLATWLIASALPTAAVTVLLRVIRS
uniref:hypothetical protein n=1 Tax=Chlorogloea sp. CCALA 695 TaxID=2107693 RepID=UPI001E36F80C|nr:hypothetical protein [Chlorogloea sp. CCALA 695]